VHNYVLNLAVIDGGMIPLIGGKAANLGELIGA
jgi:phosphoenolpyruvate synthase/pyruvate phosphate dikinase